MSDISADRLDKQKGLLETIKELFGDSGKQSIPADSPFQLPSPQMLQIQVTDSVWIQLGSHVAHTGDLKFRREGTFRKGFKHWAKKTFLTGEQLKFMKSEGRGELYVADQSKHIFIVHLNGDSIFVNGNDVLAFENTVDYKIKMVHNLGGIQSHGLFHVSLSGVGWVAFTTQGRPHLLEVSDEPVFTDPNSTVAWSEGVRNEVHLDISYKNFIGKSSGETVQLKFSGRPHGFVVIEPYEERDYQSASGTIHAGGMVSSLVSVTSAFS